MSEQKQHGHVNPRNYAQGPGAELRGEQLTVPIGHVRPNDYNYNAQSPETFNKLLESMRRFGFVQPLIVRQVGKASFEIINGEHRWRAAKELGMTDVAVTNLGTLDDAKAKQLAVILNELGGQPDQVRLADLLRDISLEVSFGDLSAVMPYSDKELSVYIESVDFSFANLSAQDTRSQESRAADDTMPPPPPEPAPKGKQSAGKLTFSLGAADAKAVSEQLAQIHADPAVALRMALDGYLASQQK